ncbi:hypothetical protein N7448_008848 [Penicillium atrosanguineum]|nr:hypothetical protein N7448_008848 [Penicillium atrosanguineum]
MALAASFKRYLPWTQTPLIINAPMSGVATSDLAVAVTRAGGLGQIGFMDNMRALSSQLETVRHELQDLMASLSDPQQLPIGVGVIVYGSPLGDWMQLFATYKPAVAWLSFASTEDLRVWTEAIRYSSPATKVWIQLGCVRDALDVAKACHPDAMVLQGSDAGGHGLAKGASIISLIPEVADALEELEIKDIPLIAAGGIVDGRGSAAALALGASGVVMGTRFLAATEARIPNVYRDAILQASDGGEATARSRIFHEIWGPNFWPQKYDGRCLRNKFYDQHMAGVPINNIRSWLSSVMNSEEEKGEAKELMWQDMGSIWAGTGVGLIKRLGNAGDFVREVREDTGKRLTRATLSL